MFAGLERTFRRFKKRRRLAAAQTELTARIANGSQWQSSPHGLDRRLVVSLTSYPTRFATLKPTLQSLLFQTTRPDATVLWIAHDELELLPPDIRDLERSGLEIRVCENLRSYKKLLPALEAWPDAIIVTADDDVYYWPQWLEELVNTYRKTGDPVICQRAHKIRLGADGLPRPYLEWRRRVEAHQRGPLIFPTGVTGVLYDPRIFHEDIARRDLIAELCPHADDVWLYWMHRMKGSQPHLISDGRKNVEWPESQVQSLRSINVDQNLNDRQIEAMIAHYGFPEPREAE
ncbi:hypothetical protein DT23_15925 [Thioclava indica]|uniref:Uncharacterized protein n=2 Tax=Thioclava indica TaxID=1353528 RepID=A0A074JQZ8_9RHOB|nr:hypothetical protein DT23_15925 [Thioclava indica]